jgi:hypothetical protein
VLTSDSVRTACLPELYSDGVANAQAASHRDAAETCFLGVEVEYRNVCRRYDAHPKLDGRDWVALFWFSEKTAEQSSVRITARERGFVGDIEELDTDQVAVVVLDAEQTTIRWARPCVILMVGSRSGPAVQYPVSEHAARYGASVAEETSDWRQAYATVERFRRERPPNWPRLPWA